MDSFAADVVTSLAQIIFADSPAGEFPNRYYRTRVHNSPLLPPEIQSSGANFGFAMNGFDFDVSGILDQKLVVDGSTNFS